VPALNIIRALLVGILLILASDSLLAAPKQSPSFPSDVADGSHKQHVEYVRTSNQREYERVLALYDAHLSDHPRDVVAAVEKCRFIEPFAYAEGESFVESASDDLERCRDALGFAPYVAEPLTQIYLLESKWGEEGITAGEQLVGAERSFPPHLRAELHARLANLYELHDDEEKAGAHAIRAVEIDPSSRVLIVAAKRLEKLGAMERARSLIAAVPAAAWNELPLGEAAELLVRVGAARLAAELLRAHASSSEDTVDRFLLARVLLSDGQIGPARDAFTEALKTSPRSNYINYIGFRENFAFERAHGSRAQAEAAYSRLRDGGFSADPFGRYRLELFLAHPLARWKVRDAAGILAFVAAIGVAAFLPLVVIVPVHYRSLVLRVRGTNLATTALPWGLRHAWYVLAVSLAAELIALYWFAYPSFEDLLGWAPFNTPPTDPRSLGRAFLVGALVTAVCLLPMQRGVLWLNFLKGQWRLRRSLGAATVALFALRFAAALWAMSVGSFRLAALGGDTERALQGLYAEHGLLALLLFIAVLVPLIEETVFRGVMLNGLARHVSFPVAAVVQALVFAAMHEDVAQLPVFFVFGLAAAWLFRRSQGLAAPLAFHALNNALAALAIVAATNALNQMPWG
jgi:membrane protease YdiL (CAAX protease family)